MRSAVFLFGVLLAIGACWLSAECEPRSPNPFPGWDETKVRKDRRASRLTILGNIRKWTDAKRALVLPCAYCRGAGKVRKGAAGRWVWRDCPRCRTRRFVPHPTHWKVVHWDHHSARYRTPERERELDQVFFRLKQDPGPAVSLQITRAKTENLVVHGNWAEAIVIEWRGSARARTTQTWIREGRDWCLSVPEVDDEAFVRHAYPTFEENPEQPKDPERAAKLLVREVLDDRTIVLGTGETREVVALAGIEAKRQTVGGRTLDPARWLRDLLLGEEVRIEHPSGKPTRDPGGRLRAYLFRLPEGLNVNVEMVRQGRARANAKPPYPHAARLIECETRARRAGRGIWATR